MTQTSKPVSTNLSWIGWLCLFILVFQNVSYTLCMRHARSRTQDLFLPSSVVLMSECAKLITCLLVLTFNGQFRISCQLIRHNLKDALLTCAPALIYVVQNRLLISALSHLDAATFQVVYQLKLLTTALFSVLILGMRVSRIQWISLIILFCGISIVDPPSTTNRQTEFEKSQNTSFGLLCVFCASILSGLACILFEMLLKSSTKSLWLRNVELAFGSLLTGIPTQLISDSSFLNEKGFFYGFDWFIWLVVGLHSFGGLIVAMVVKYADNMLKAFACSISIVISALFSVLFLGMQLNLVFILGTFLVLLSTCLYAMYPAQSVSKT